MDITITPKKLSGTIAAIPSKSQAHRHLICAAFSDRQTQILCAATNRDIEATVDCLNALGATIQKTEYGYDVTPIVKVPTEAVLNCCESGSTLRFMLPIVGALGVKGVFKTEGRLSQRPLSPLWEEMQRMGCHLSWETPNELLCQGQLKTGTYTIAGNVSSQFISGLLFALSLIPGKSQLDIVGKTESKPYIDMTKKALSAFSVDISKNEISGSYPFRSPGRVQIEGDWSNGAFFLAAEKLGSALNITGLCKDSPQGDRAIQEILQQLTNYCTIDAADIPDLVPILSVFAAANQGAVFTNVARLRLKESDRVASVADMLNRFGIQTEYNENTLTIYPGKFRGCTIDSFNDHRIAMSSAIAATIADGEVTILDAHCVNKSYPGFWEDYRTLGGSYEQYIR